MAMWMLRGEAAARGAAESIEPGVERSGTPGTEPLNIRSPRSGRQRNQCVLVIANATGRFAGSGVFDDFHPGVSLRFTPGSMPSSAARTKNNRSARVRPAGRTNRHYF
jgi:hypothetical protein